MRIIRLAFACLIWIFLSGASFAFDEGRFASYGLTQRDGVYHVVNVIDGDTLVIRGGMQVRLVGIQTPKLPLGRKNFATWPLAGEAKARLSELTLDKQVRLYTGTTAYDRHDRLLAHVLVEDKNGAPVWVQHQLVRDGLARVYSFADNRLALDPLMMAERKARSEQKAIWGHAYYAIWSAQKIANAVKSRSYFGDRFELVEGRVTGVTTFSDRAYINFGPDWRDDFSVMVKAEDFKFFGQGKQAARQFLESLQGKKLQVRGWVYLKNGPMMRVTHKERIVIIPE